MLTMDGRKLALDEANAIRITSEGVFGRTKEKNKSETQQQI
jgi:hypothetical protein